MFIHIKTKTNCQISTIKKKKKGKKTDNQNVVPGLKCNRWKFRVCIIILNIIGSRCLVEKSSIVIKTSAVEFRIDLRVTFSV